VHLAPQALGLAVAQRATQPVDQRGVCHHIWANT
jgi:hypothetical protein